MILRRLKDPVAISWVLTVLLPTVIYAAYLGFVATPRYQSGFRIQIKSSSQNTMPSFGQVFGLAGMASAASDNGYAVTQYLESNDAIADIDRLAQLKARYSKGNIDYFSRMPVDASIERWQRYWNNRISARFETTSSTVAFDVTAFSPKDAYDLATVSLHLSEQLLNGMTRRARSDAVRYAEAEVRDSEEGVREVERKLYRTRNKSEIIDAGKQVSAEMARIGKLQELADLARSDLEVRRKYLAPGTPSRQLAESRLRTAEAALNEARGRMTSVQSSPGGTLAGKVSAFDELQGEKVFAEKRLQNALAALTAAQSEAQRQQLYLDTIVHPRVAEEQVFPRIFWNVGTMLFFACSLWAIVLMVGLAIRDHVRV